MEFDPLSCWNDGTAKERIMEFIARTTQAGGPDFIAPQARIAVFDNDGTLWTEQPLYTQLQFALERIQMLADEHPEWHDDPALAAAISDDKAALAALDYHGMGQIVAQSHTAITTEELAAVVSAWLKTARHPRFDRPYTETIYQPQLQLLTYLREQGYRTYIVSGGGVEFMRTFTEETYGVPPEQVIGSSVRTQYELRDGRGVLVQLPEIDHIDDGPGKPVAINKFIGQRPTIAVGNSDGDLEMMQYATTGDGPSLAIYIRHDDAQREYAYDKEASVGRLERGLQEAAERDWLVVSMRADWKTIFASEASA